MLVHPASINRFINHTFDVIKGIKGINITALFGPQHGIRGETQDNMIEWEGFIDSKTGIPIFSLYGKHREPTNQMLDLIDILIVDLQDVGSRYYTFIWTLALVMKRCEEMSKTVVVLDRPNPINGVDIEGNVLNLEFASFVGLKPLPVRHGMTIGEIALYLKDRYYKTLDLHVIAMKRWKRRLFFDQTSLPWVMPSPNMPTIDTAIVYPGQCLLEGTILSEGRGTTRPFEIFGAPFIDPDKLVKRLKDYNPRGVVFRPMYFIPTFQKHAGVLCGGAQIHVVDRMAFTPFKTTVCILKAVSDLYPKVKLWRDPPYEYEFVKPPIDIIAGTDKLRFDIEQGKPLDEMQCWWMCECMEFDKSVRKKYLLYD
ncbi:MAG: DUF1343 domain-containing protein [Thermodesulfovibrionales bacterium]|nr:DUF1343 domain-containing protein [Thermodesulfovibrionales bacterium]